MNWLQTIMQFANVVIFLGGLYLMFDRRRIQRMPDNPGERLEIYARIAARAAESLYPDNPGKKDLAIAMVIDLYKEWKLPVPSKTAIAMAVSAESLMLPKPVG